MLLNSNKYNCYNSKVLLWHGKKPNLNFDLFTEGKHLKDSFIFFIFFILSLSGKVMRRRPKRLMVNALLYKWLPVGVLYWFLSCW